MVNSMARSGTPRMRRHDGNASTASSSRAARSTSGDERTAEITATPKAPA
jgi:hypothetical protein